MRPGLVFVGLFAILIGLYLLLEDTLGSLSTFLLQAALVLVVLAGATWFRYVKRRSGWLFLGDDSASDDDSAPVDADPESTEYRPAS